MKTRNTQLSLEVLEDRRMLSITLEAGLLSVVGTDSAERITIEESNMIVGHKLTQNAAGMFEWMPIYAPRLQATRSDMDGNVLETGNFLPLQVASLDIMARGGSDVITNDTGRWSDVGAGAGNDTVYGGSGRDVISGAGGNDRLYGHDGDDELTGGTGHDYLSGGDGHDLLRGGNGNDSLVGWDGRDSLYGENGNDSLRGGTHADGLCGGAGLDTVQGGNGSDRFLALKDTPGFLGIGVWDPDQIVDLQSSDARINFEHGTGDSSNGVQYFGNLWRNSEIEQVDQALAILHQRTGNKTLLKKSDGGEITFRCQGSPTGDDIGPFGWNRFGDVTVLERAFDSGAGAVLATALHELGHNWEESNPNWEAFKALSGWKQLAWWDSKDNYIEAEDGWWYLEARDDEFVSDYAKTNPLEDFAESFAVYFLDYAGDATGYDADAGAAKLDLIDAWVNTID